MNAPEAPLAGYERFLSGHREKIQAENQDLPFDKVTKILGNMVSRPTSLQKQVCVVTCWSACFVIDMTIGYPGLSNVSEILIYLNMYCDTNISKILEKTAIISLIHDEQ